MTLYLYSQGPKSGDPRWLREAFRLLLCPAELLVLRTRNISMEFLVRSRSAEMANSWCFYHQAPCMVAWLVTRMKWPLRLDGRSYVHLDSLDNCQGAGISNRECTGKYPSLLWNSDLCVHGVGVEGGGGTGGCGTSDSGSSVLIGTLYSKPLYKGHCSRSLFL